MSKPEAWLSESGQKCVTDSEKKSLEIEGMSFDDSEPLYSASTIRESLNRHEEDFIENYPHLGGKVRMFIGKIMEEFTQKKTGKGDLDGTGYF